jgi:hypothetical protein
MKLNGIAVGTIAAFGLYHGMRGIAKLRGTDLAEGEPEPEAVGQSAP